MCNEYQNLRAVVYGIYSTQILENIHLICIAMPLGPAVGLYGCDPSYYIMEAEYDLWQKQRHRQYILDCWTNYRARYFLHYYWYLHNLYGHNDNDVAPDDAASDVDLYRAELPMGPRRLVGEFLDFSP